MSKFTEFCADHFKKYFELHPTDAIYYGVEGFDHLLNDYSDDTYKAEKAFAEVVLRLTAILGGERQHRCRRH